ncbi:MAG: hypothetical protein JO257_25305 [Deltaproteobacteria bacterium]|nr:hypothetical protein [Deltaproteobacteria bacterium]
MVGESPSGGPYYGGAPVGSGGEEGDDGAGLDGSASGSVRTGLTAPTDCAASNEASTYWPYARNGMQVLGTPADFPWSVGFHSLSSGHVIECGSDKAMRSDLDVTAGCLDAQAFQSMTRGQIHGTTDGYYRSFALPDDAADGEAVKWTDQGGEYDFYFTGWTGNVSNPGFKVFARYLTEYDLYVASWRQDGVVQIQKKECGVYTILKRIPNYPAPTPNQWHHIRFEAVGNDLRLYTDGQLAVETTDDTFAAGTSGIRIDDAEGAYLDNWHVFAP